MTMQPVIYVDTPGQRLFLLGELPPGDLDRYREWLGISRVVRLVLPDGWVQWVWPQ